GPKGNELSPRKISCGTARNSEATAPTRNAITTTCQPKNAPTIIIKSASPRPSASLPKPFSNKNLTARSSNVPPSAPPSPVNRPICQLPAGIHAGGGPQTGQGYSPGLTGPIIHHWFTAKPRAGSGIAWATAFGHGQGNATAKIRPISVPGRVIDSGIV